MQNLAPRSNAWISVPHMKLIIVRLLTSVLVASRSLICSELPTQTDQTRENFAIQDREAAAIHVSLSTPAPQRPYSTPQVCWRRDGSGVWVNGDGGA